MLRYLILFRVVTCDSARYYILCLYTLWAFHWFEGDGLTLLKGSKAFHDKRGMMHKNIRPLLNHYEAVPLASFHHLTLPFMVITAHTMKLHGVKTCYGSGAPQARSSRSLHAALRQHAMLFSPR